MDWISIDGAQITAERAANSCLGAESGGLPTRRLKLTTDAGVKQETQTGFKPSALAYSIYADGPQQRRRRRALVTDGAHRARRSSCALRAAFSKVDGHVEALFSEEDIDGLHSLAQIDAPPLHICHRRLPLG
jgi:hypothetical protein